MIEEKSRTKVTYGLDGPFKGIQCGLWLEGGNLIGYNTSNEDMVMKVIHPNETIIDITILGAASSSIWMPSDRVTFLDQCTFTIENKDKEVICKITPEDE